MTSPTFTNRRLYGIKNPAALVMAFQSAQGTPALDLGADSKVMWVRDHVFDPGHNKDDFQGTNGSSFKRLEGRATLEKKPVVTVRGGATPDNIEWLLRSMLGSWSGSPKVLALRDGTPEYATLAIIESTPIPNPQKLIRVWDAWAHRVTLSMLSGLTTLDVEADFACRDYDRTVLSLDDLSNAEIGLPGGAPVAITNVFANNPAKVEAPAHGFKTGDVVFIRDVTGTVEVNFNTYQITKVDADNFTLSVNGSLFLPYFGGGTARQIAAVVPAAISEFAPHQFRLYRDPAGANASIAVDELVIDFVSDLSHESWNDAAPQVVNDGFTRVSIRLKGVWTDETYAMQDDSEKLAATFKRFSAQWSDGSRNLTIDMKNVDWKPSSTGWGGKRWERFEVEGEAFLDSLGDIMTVTLTP